jgi:hypothetical protein
MEQCATAIDFQLILSLVLKIAGVTESGSSSEGLGVTRKIFGFWSLGCESGTFRLLHAVFFFQNGVSGILLDVYGLDFKI